MTPIQTLDQLGISRFDYLVNNAGISHHASIEMTTEAELDALLTPPEHGRGKSAIGSKVNPF